MGCACSPSLSALFSLSSLALSPSCSLALLVQVSLGGGPADELVSQDMTVVPAGDASVHLLAPEVPGMRVTMDHRVGPRAPSRVCACVCVCVCV